MKYIPVFMLCLCACGQKTFERDVIQVTPVAEPGIISVFVAPQSERIRISPCAFTEMPEGLREFLDHLQEVISREDTTALLAVLDSNIMISNGGGIAGIDDFKTFWLSNQYENHDIWERMNRMLVPGGCLENSTVYYSPFAARQLYPDISYIAKVDCYFSGVIIQPKTKVYEKPDTTGPVNAIAEYDLVLIDPEYDSREFYRIATPDSIIRGYVRPEYVFLCAENVLEITLKNGRWYITEISPFD